VYSVIGSLMPYGDPGSVTATLLGGSRALWLANSPAAYIPRMTFHHPMAVDLLAGDRDPQRPEARRLAAMLHARGQQAVYTEVPGATHTWRGARLEAPYMLAFASAHLAGARRITVPTPLALRSHRLPGAPPDRPRRWRVTT
jgi:acetyl esterase/lipase